MKNTLSVIRIDPTKKTVAKMMMRVGKDATSEVRRILRARTVGWKELFEVNDTVLIVAGGLDVDEAMQGFRLLGTEDTGGIGLLFGKGKISGGMADVPVDVDWVLKRIKWVDGENLIGLQQRAQDLLPMVNDEIRQAMLEAIEASEDQIWFAADKPELHSAAITLGIGTPSTKGQRLSPLGREVRAILLADQQDAA